MRRVLAALLIGWIVSYVLTPLVAALARKAQVIAIPGGRRAHASATPLLGGVAMYIGFIVAVVTVIVMEPDVRIDTTAIGILVSGTFVAIIGVLDDKYDLPGWVQAGSIILGGLLLALLGIRVYGINNPLNVGSSIQLHLLSVPATVFWVLLVTKAVDCMDGVDGLAAGISAIASATLLLMSLSANPKSLEMASLMRLSGVMSAALLGASLGFLRFNYPPAKIFMGTVGAQFLGFMLAAISLAGAFKVTTLLAIAVPVLVLGVPLFDTTFVVLRRAISGRRIDEADRTHLHHRLLDKGMSTRGVIWAIYGLTFVLCAAAYVLFLLARQWWAV